MEMKQETAHLVDAVCERLGVPAVVIDVEYNAVYRRLELYANIPGTQEWHTATHDTRLGDAPFVALAAAPLYKMSEQEVAEHTAPTPEPEPVEVCEHCGQEIE